VAQCSGMSRDSRLLSLAPWRPNRSNHRLTKHWYGLTIYSEVRSAEEMAEQVGVVPDEAWNKSDLNERGRPYTTTAIGFRSLAPKKALPSEHLSDLVMRIEPMMERLRAEANLGGAVRLKLALFADTDNVMFTLPADLLTQLGSFGLELEFDIYKGCDGKRRLGQRSGMSPEGWVSGADTCCRIRYTGIKRYTDSPTLSGTCTGGDRPRRPVLLYVAWRDHKPRLRQCSRMTPERSGT
jgi:hypothetical protein